MECTPGWRFIRIFAAEVHLMNTMRNYVICLVFGIIAQPLFAQEKKSLWDHKLIKRFVSSQKDSTRSAGFIAVPAVGYAQETGLEFGIRGVFIFCLNKTLTAFRSSHTMFT